jgi:nucleoid DNA-binding protein
VVEAVLRGVLARIEGGVGKGETVNLVGFGRF